MLAVLISFQHPQLTCPPCAACVRAQRRRRSVDAPPPSTDDLPHCPTCPSHATLPSGVPVSLVYDPRCCDSRHQPLANTITIQTEWCRRIWPRAAARTSGIVSINRPGASWWTRSPPRISTGFSCVIRMSGRRSCLPIHHPFELDFVRNALFAMSLNVLYMYVFMYVCLVWYIY